MPERTVKAAVTSYQHPDGTTRFALRGDVVEVSADAVKDFDRLENEAVPTKAQESPASDDKPESKPKGRAKAQS